MAYSSQQAPERMSPYEGNFAARGVITVGTEAADVIRVSVTLQTGGKPLYEPGFVQAYLSDNADGSTLAAAAPTGGWVIGTAGLLIPLVTNKAAIFRSNSSGVFNIDVTDSGAKTFYLVVILPDGSQVVSGAVTFA